MITFWQGIFHERPSAFLPDLIQIASSPTSNVELRMMARLQASRSSPSPFCAYHGLRMMTLSRVTSSHCSGWTFHAAEFENVASLSSTRWQRVNSSITGRYVTRRMSGAPGFPASASCFASGYHTSFISMPWPDVSFFH